ncbi:MAG: cupin domain-containing protein [Bacteroidales bacterium]|nr:cupin domain-containing protein [Bacteroidales bacterium]
MEQSIEKGEKFIAADAVAYSTQAVISRQVMKGENGNITLFAFDKGEGLSEHTTPFDAMALILDGKAGITIGGKLNILKAGEAIIMPANIPHALNAIERYKMMLVMIRG